MSRVSNPQAAVAAAGAARPERPTAQMTALKRALESQKDQAAELLRLLEPKGKVIDIRV